MRRTIQFVTASTLQERENFRHTEKIFSSGYTRLAALYHRLRRRHDAQLPPKAYENKKTT